MAKKKRQLTDGITLKDGQASVGNCGVAARLIMAGRPVALKTLRACMVKCYEQMRQHRRRIAELTDRIRFLMGKTADFR